MKHNPACVSLMDMGRGDASAYNDMDELVNTSSVDDNPSQVWHDPPPSGSIIDDLERYMKAIQDNTRGSVHFNPPPPPTEVANCIEPFDQEPERVGQSRRGSLAEALVNIAVGASINYVVNLLIFPLFGWNISARSNVLMVVIYTGISLARSYGLRRFFNRRGSRK